MAIAPVEKDAEAKPAAPRDNFDIPGPIRRTGRRGRARVGKLETEVTSYKELSEQWNKKRGDEQQLQIHLQKVATHLADLDRRATGIANTMNRIRAIIGDDDAATRRFAPPETPYYVQSLAKTFTRRAVDMSKLTTDAAIASRTSIRRWSKLTAI